MGCFNSVGFYSKMPIHYKDDVVLFICAGYKGANSDTMPLYTVDRFSPIAFQVTGKYDEYGGIEDVVKDVNVELLEKTFGVSIEELVNALGDASFIPRCELTNREKEDSFRDPSYELVARIIDNFPKTAYETLHEEKLNGPYTRSNMYLTYCMERKDVFDVFVKHNTYTAYREEYDAATRVIKTLGTGVNIITDLNSITWCEAVYDFRDKIRNNPDSCTQEEKDLYSDVKHIRGMRFDDTLSHGLAYEFLAYKKEDVIDPEAWREIIFNFIDFTTALDYVGGYFCPNAYGSQSIDDQKPLFKALNETYANIINRMKTYDEYED